MKINDLDFPIDYSLNDFYFDESIIYCPYDTHIDKELQNNLAIYDINNRSYPQLIDEINDIDNINSMVFQVDYIYLNDWTNIQIYEKKAEGARPLCINHPKLDLICLTLLESRILGQYTFRDFGDLHDGDWVQAVLRVPIV